MYKSKIEELELQNAELSKISDKSYSEDLTNKEKLTTVLDELEKVTSEKKSLELELTKCKKELSGIIEQAHDDVHKLIDKLNREKSKTSIYKSRALSAESKNNDVIIEVRKRTDSLASQYGTSIVALHNDLKQEREKVTNINKEKDILSDENIRLKTEISKLKVQLRTLTINNEDLKTNLETERSNNSAKIASLNISTSSKIDGYNKSFSDLRNKFREGIAKISGFDIKSLPEDDDELIDSAYRFVNEIMNSETAKVTQDALYLRKVLRIEGTDKHLSDVFSDMRSKIAKLDDKCSAIQSENERIQTQTERTMRDNERLQSSQEELLEWSRWGMSLFRQISDMSPQGQKDKDIRLTIEEQFIGDLGFGSLRSKLSILRSEKQFLLSHSIPGSSKTNTNSIRPVAMVIVFSNILQGLSGTQKSTILIKEKKPAPKL
ncbi:hypothetical protein TVAG_107100 [Trichomonas vaginalis G3]|uniref:Uncharacterized protein n=1 Tax=Trichomonas vaginalis (strain ATCC PRA-98 / G3) TaxID=412133 RepID=A2FE51_TRIV3|nr:hypothetical protein TVAGG3_0429930 [Trichomonas vaginalis G3]EAX96823.1 hypothetical protein TVAG_107100 [Trichomonas vaginalis G3]KAI5536680.1 hypothetical protein TVAGG3_0429930 [Trichomonas vaginalis G3]|eukprot:XP_001309753.1 hypothetical protein [Trichomonas vaginalis G3]